MANPLGVFEDIDTAARRRLFSFLGVPWLATPWAWVSVPGFLALGVLIAAAGGVGDSGEECFMIGLGYGALIFAANILHTVGHILSARAAGGPVDTVLITATRHLTLYLGAQDGVPRRTHLGRALGGPLMNLTLGLIVLALAGSGRFLGFFGTVNLVIGVGALLPIRSVDGEVIWRETLGRAE